MQRHLQQAMAKAGRVYLDGALLEHLRPHLLSPGELWCVAGTMRLVNQVMSGREKRAGAAEFKLVEQAVHADG